MQNKLIEEIILQYVDAVDRQDIPKASSYMDPEFRLIMKSNQGGEEPSVIKKETYLQLMEQKKVGGSKRSVRIHSFSSIGKSVVALVTLENDKMLMESAYSFIETNKEWKLISDQVQITFKTCQLK